MDIIKAIVLIWVTTGDVISDATYNASACFGSDWSTCSTLLMDKCTQDQKIHIMEQNYGVTVGACVESPHNEGCLRADSGCCAYKENDCLAGYTQLHSYNFYRQCSGNSACTTNVGRAYLICNGRTELSSYATIKYACITDIAQMCSQSLTKMEEVHMIFDKQKSSFMFASNCECRLASAGRLVVKYVDIRMARVHTESERTNCSSAYLTSEPAIELPPKCVDAIDESSNFFHGTVVDSNTHSVVITLMDIYKHGDDDAPEYVWIAVSARNNAQVEVTCIRTPFVQYTTTTTETASQTIHDNTVNADVGGLKVWIIVVVAVVAVILLVAGVGTYVIYCRSNTCNVVEYDEPSVDVIVTTVRNTDHAGRASSESTHSGTRNVYSVIPFLDNRISEYVMGTLHNKNEEKGSQKHLASYGTLAKIRHRFRRLTALLKKDSTLPSLYRSPNASVTSFRTKKETRKLEMSSPISEEKYRPSNLTKMTLFKKKWIAKAKPKSINSVAYEDLTNTDNRELKEVYMKYGEFQTADCESNVQFQTKLLQQMSSVHKSSSTLKIKSGSNVEQRDLKEIQCEHEYDTIDESNENNNGIGIVDFRAPCYVHEKGLCLHDNHDDDDTQGYLTPMSTFKYSSSNDTTSINESRF
ncbi:uncharacterized protein LOC127850785 isoform X2 [Dreissena polymorpha]|uniref:uncharacterized protein LOC127850785 isoform X2 n=1 Tax=Dreissena polymorpha TaxID=45954 RepID=UPI0022656021|nr:uncharacterized protein LOC127850785 isoform X2 [Dreissena polymorpha]